MQVLAIIKNTDVHADSILADHAVAFIDTNRHFHLTGAEVATILISGCGTALSDISMQIVEKVVEITGKYSFVFSHFLFLSIIGLIGIGQAILSIESHSNVIRWTAKVILSHRRFSFRENRDTIKGKVDAKDEWKVSDHAVYHGSSGYNKNES
jgi:hypothetical protein